MKTIKKDFGQFTFLDEHTVVAEAYKGVEIDAEKVKQAIELIESELSGEYGMILDRKSEYSIMPIEVYEFFASIERLKVLSIVSYRIHDALPEGTEEAIYGKNIKKFNSIESAHEWMKQFF